MIRQSYRLPLLVALLLLVACGPAKDLDDPILVGAAISLRPVLDSVVHMYSESYPGRTLRVSYAGSGTLQHQIEFGAPIDLFLSAARVHVDSLASKGFVREDTRRTLASNTLVLIMPVRRPPVATISDLQLPGIARIAIGDPSIVPAGRYTIEALTKMGLEGVLDGKLIFTKNALQALAYVRSGVVDAGFVYASDARSLPPVRTILTIPDSLHSKILYEGIILSASRRPDEAGHFLEYLSEDTVRALFTTNGFRENDLW
jgi:molybdate transport system substrate-binding protein